MNHASEENKRSATSTPPDASSATLGSAPAVAVLLADLFLAPRFADVIRQQGGMPLLTETPEAFLQAVDSAYPVLAIVDVAAAGDWAKAIQRIKLRPHTRLMPIYAFGSHIDTATLQAARRAGADHAWARSRMMQELPTLVARHVAPPVQWPAGWDDVLSPSARRGVEEFNLGHYHEQHEWFEQAWLEEPRAVREMYQGILLVGVAFYQIERHNWQGALKTFRRGLPRLRTLPDVCQGIDIAALRQTAEEIHAEITALGPDQIAAFDTTRFPKIKLVS